MSLASRMCCILDLTSGFVGCRAASVRAAGALDLPKVLSDWPHVWLCSLQIMDVELLKRQTAYDVRPVSRQTQRTDASSRREQGHSPNDAHIRHFWDVLKLRFDDIERAKVRRLPAAILSL